MEKEEAREMNTLTGLSSFPEIGNRLNLFDEHHQTVEVSDRPC